MKTRDIFTFVICFVVMATVIMMYYDEQRDAWHPEDEPTIEETVHISTEEIVETTEEATTVDIFELKAIEVQVKQAELDATILDPMEWFIAYKALIEEYAEWVDPPLSVYDIYSAEEIRYMQKCIETETYQCDFISKCNVASVILNRIDHEKFPNDGVAVVTAPNQFVYGRDNISESTVLALEYVAMCGRTTYEALFFHSGPPRDTFCKRPFIFRDECGHNFY